MEPRIQYAKTSDGVSIAYSTLGDGPPLLHVPFMVSHIEMEWHIPEMRRERDLSKALLEYLLQRDWAWEMRIDNLSLLHDTGTRQELALRFDFGGERTAPRSSP